MVRIRFPAAESLSLAPSHGAPEGSFSVAGPLVYRGDVPRRCTA